MIAYPTSTDVRPTSALVNRVRTSDRCEPWTFGLSALMRNLAERGLLHRPA